MEEPEGGQREERGQCNKDPTVKKEEESVLLQCVRRRPSLWPANVWHGPTPTCGSLGSGGLGVGRVQLKAVPEAGGYR